MIFLKKFKIDWFSAVLFLAIVARLTNLITVNYVSGESMYPTLNDRDIVFGSNLEIKTDSIKYEDVVVLEIDEKLLIKRVVGLPGDTVEIKENVLYINEEKVEESYANWTYETVFIDVDKLELKDNEYFVLGDNRNFSRDSRDFGAIKKDQLVSKIYFVE